MAIKVWTGNAQARAQVSTITLSGTVISSTQTITVTINGKTVVYTAVGVVANNAAAAEALLAELQASTLPEFTEIEWTDTTVGTTPGIITGTAVTAGVPFEIDSAVTSGSTTVTVATPTTATGPNHWNNANNWAPTGVPDADEVVFENSAVSVLYALDTPLAQNSLTFRSSFTGTVGLPIQNTNGYWEYRPRYLEIETTTIIVGPGEGQGSGRLLIDLGTEAATAVVTRTSAPLDQGMPALVLTGGDGLNLTVNRGSVGVAVEAGQTCPLGYMTVGYIESPSSDADVTLGDGVTGPISGIEVAGGTVVVQAGDSSITTIDSILLTAGTLIVQGYASASSLDIDGGECFWESSEEIVAARVGSEGALDFTRDARSRLVSDCTLAEGGIIRDPQQTVTWATGIDLPSTGLAGVTVDLGENFRITPGAIGVVPPGDPVDGGTF